MKISIKQGFALAIVLIIVIVLAMYASTIMAFVNTVKALFEETETVDTLTRAAETSQTVELPEGTDSMARFESYFYEDSMYLVFNGISNRDTDYYYVPSGTLTITGVATGESTGMKSFKIALWEKLDNQTQYVPDTTVYFYTNGDTHTYTITGLDPTKEYRVNVSYDAYGYYIYGKMEFEGMTETLPETETEDDTAEDAA